MILSRILTENVLDLKAEIEALKSALANSENKASQFEERASHFEQKAEHFKTEYEKIIAQLMAAKRIAFGKKSERFVADGEPLPLFEDSAPLIEDNSEETDYEEITIKRKKRKQPSPLEIPVREEIVPVEDKICNGCGSEMRVIRYEDSHKLNYQPAIFEMVRTRREVVACNRCDQSIKTAPKPLSILPKCRVTEALLAHITVSKVLDRQPLYHLEQKFEREFGCHIQRATMARWMIQLAEQCQPLINLMKDTLLSYDIASIDATSLQVLKEPSKKSQAYCMRGGPPEEEVTIYEYNAYAHKDYVDETLTDFNGIIHCDAEAVWSQVGKRPGIQLSYCHAHARRKFETIIKSGQKEGLAKQALQIYKSLYLIERDAKEKKMSPEERLKLRQEKSKPIIDQFKNWLDFYSQKTLPKSPLGQAIRYCLNHWEGLSVFLTDGRVEMDNNHTERDIKPFVMARKNFLFSCTQKGADSLGVLFSLVITAKHHGLNPIHYLEMIFKKIPACKTFHDFEPLLPWNFKKDFYS